MSTVGTYSYCSIPSYPGTFGTDKESKILHAMLTFYVNADTVVGRKGREVKPFSMYLAERHLRRELPEDGAVCLPSVLNMAKTAYSGIEGKTWWSTLLMDGITTGDDTGEEERTWKARCDTVLTELEPLRTLKKNSQKLHWHIFTQGGLAGTDRQQLASLLKEMQSVQQPLRKIWETLPPSSEDLNLFHCATTDWDILRIEDFDFQMARPKFQDDGTITQRLKDYQQSFLGLFGPDDVATKFARLAETTQALGAAVLVRWQSENPDSDGDRGARGIESGDGDGGAIDILYGARGDDHME